MLRRLVAGMLAVVLPLSTAQAAPTAQVVGPVSSGLPVPIAAAGAGSLNLDLAAAQALPPVGGGLRALPVLAPAVIAVPGPMPAPSARTDLARVSEALPAARLDRLPAASAWSESAAVFDSAAVRPAAAPLMAPGRARPGSLGLRASDPEEDRAAKPEPPAARPGARFRRWHKIAAAAIAVLLAAAAAYHFLSPRLRPAPPPPTDVVSEQAPYRLEADAAARIEKGGGAARPAEALRLLGHADTVESVSVGEDGRAAVTVGADGSWRVWDLQTGKSFLPREYPGKVRGALFADGGRSLILVDEDATVRVLDLEKNEVRSISQGGGPIAAYGVSPDAQRVAVASKDGRVQVLELRSAQAEAFQADGKVLLLASTSRGTVLLTARRGIHRMILLEPGKPPAVVAERYIPGAKVLAAAADREGARLVAAADMAGDQGVVYWEPASNQIILLTAEDFGVPTLALASVAVDPRGARVALLESDGSLWLWSPGGRPAKLGMAVGGAKVFFSTDGRLVYTTEPGGPVRFWRVP